MLFLKKIKGYLILLAIIAGISLAGYVAKSLVGYGKFKALVSVNETTAIEVDRQGDRAAGLAEATIENTIKTTERIIYVAQHKSSSANTCMPDDIAASHGWVPGVKSPRCTPEGEQATKRKVPGKTP